MARKWRVGFCDVCEFGLGQLPLPVEDPDSQLPKGYETTGACLAPVLKTGKPMVRKLGPKTTKAKCKQFTWSQPEREEEADQEN